MENCFGFISMAILVVLLQFMALLEVEGLVFPGLTITVENEFVGVGQRLGLHCTLDGKDLGQQSLLPFNRFVHKFDTSFFGGDLFRCTFAAAGKPTTTIDVFKGYSFAHRPCDCLGMDHCFWQALNEGFWCNSKFIQPWG
jgi:hypothetical protein